MWKMFAAEIAAAIIFLLGSRRISRDHALFNEKTKFVYRMRDFAVFPNRGSLDSMFYITEDGRCGIVAGNTPISHFSHAQMLFSAQYIRGLPLKTRSKTSDALLDKIVDFFSTENTRRRALRIYFFADKVFLSSVSEESASHLCFPIDGRELELVWRSWHEFRSNYKTVFEKCMEMCLDYVGYEAAQTFREEMSKKSYETNYVFLLFLFLRRNTIDVPRETLAKLRQAGTLAEKTAALTSAYIDKDFVMLGKRLRSNCETGLFSHEQIYTQDKKVAQYLEAFSEGTRGTSRADVAKVLCRISTKTAQRLRTAGERAQRISIELMWNQKFWSLNRGSTWTTKLYISVDTCSPGKMPNTEKVFFTFPGKVLLFDVLRDIC